MEAVSYGSVYVARIAMGASDMQTVKAFQEAEAYDGPAIIIAYSHCIAHGYDLTYGLEQQKNAVLSGYWPLMRYNPALRNEGKNPFQLDSKAPSIPLKEYAYREARYTMLARSHPAVTSVTAPPGSVSRYRPSVWLSLAVASMTSRAAHPTSPNSSSGPTTEMAAYARPQKLRTGAATDVSWHSDSRTLMATPVRRTSASARSKTAAVEIVRGVNCGKPAAIRACAKAGSKAAIAFPALVA